VPAPGFLERFLDKVAVAWTGGVRIRVHSEGDRLLGTALGRTPGPPPERIVRIVLELAPQGPGTIDVVHHAQGHWMVRTRGELADPRLEQRLRNTLGNL
jgi:hypothetical protein